MSLSIGSMSGANPATMGVGRMQRPDPSQMANQFFSKLDVDGKGYIDKTDLQKALSGLSSDHDSSEAASADEIFTALDADSDGKVTQSEMSETLSRLSEELDAQFNQGRMEKARDGMPPPPPPGEDQGLSQDELSQMASDAQAAGDGRASELSTLAQNFDAADTDQDGKVTFKEAMAYKEKTREDSTSGTDGFAGTSGAASQAAGTNAAVMHRVMQLLASYRTEEGGSVRGTAITATV